MPLDHTLNGRSERRLPIVVMVRLTQAERRRTQEPQVLNNRKSEMES